MEFICDTGTVESYLGKWGKRVNFGNIATKILTKSMRENKWCDGSGRKKIRISVISLPKFLLPETTAQLPSEVPQGEWLKWN